MNVTLTPNDTKTAERLADEAGVSIDVLVGGLLRWTAVLHGRQIRDDELPEHPADRDPEEKPSLNSASENIRRECGLFMTAVDVGHTAAGPLWVWKAWDANNHELPVAIEHDARTLNQGLLLFLTGYRLGMRAIPF